MGSNPIRVARNSLLEHSIALSYSLHRQCGFAVLGITGRCIRISYLNRVKITSVAARTLVLSLFLSLTPIAAFVVYFAFGWTTFESEDLEYGYTLLSRLFAFAWPASVPLSLALVLLHRRSRVVAYLSAVALVPLTLTGFLLAGLLQSGILAIASAALSLPAWLALLLVRAVQQR